MKQKLNRFKISRARLIFIFALILISVMLLSSCDLWGYKPVEFEIEDIEIALDGKATSEVASVALGTSRAISLHAWVHGGKSVNRREYTVSWEIVGDNLGCSISVTNLCCTNIKLTDLHLGEKTGQITIIATAKSLNTVSAYLKVNIVGEDLESQGRFFATSFGGSLMNFPHISEHYQDCEENPISLFTNSQDLEIFSETYSQTYHESQGRWVRDARFTYFINSFNDKYFEDNYLLLFPLVASGGAYRFSFVGTTLDNGVLTIELNHVSLGGGHTALVNWVAFIGVEKFPQGTEINIIINNT
ncbi:MAG: hypothetical protein FWD49_07785 [Firmicutes bacterium]|nr:hypothetical protein [Bacillota bacterium]